MGGAERPGQQHQSSRLSAGNSDKHVRGCYSRCSGCQWSDGSSTRPTRSLNRCRLPHAASWSRCYRSSPTGGAGRAGRGCSAVAGLIVGWRAIVGRAESCLLRSRTPVTSASCWCIACCSASGRHRPSSPRTRPDLLPSRGPVSAAQASPATLAQHGACGTASRRISSSRVW